MGYLRSDALTAGEYGAPYGVFSSTIKQVVSSRHGNVTTKYTNKLKKVSKQQMKKHTWATVSTENNHGRLKLLIPAFAITLQFRQ